jgi:hypothetical protein
MKHLLGIFLLSLYLVACAGNPPAWWNPGNRYGQTPASAQVTDQAAVQKPTVPQEENIDPLPDNSYEEEVIAPLPEEEDTPTVQPTDEPGVNTLPMPSVLE